MKSSKLIFEKVGDVNSTYAYLAVYAGGSNAPFMEIGVTDEGKLRYTIYSTPSDISLSQEDWRLVEEKALEFLPRVLADEQFVAALRSSTKDS